MKNKVLFLLVLFAFSLNCYSQKELRLILSVQPTIKLNETSVFNKYPNAFERKNTYSLGFGVGY